MGKFLRKTVFQVYNPKNSVVTSVLDVVVAGILSASSSVFSLMQALSIETLMPAGKGHYFTPLL